MTAGWGRFGKNQVVMPGQGRADERFHTPEEREKMGITDKAAKTYDIRLNDNAYWRNIPVAVWEYKLGGYRVLKKWLSYRAHGVINRALTPEEVELFTAIARRIAAILAITK